MALRALSIMFELLLRLNLSILMSKDFYSWHEERILRKKHIQKLAFNGDRNWRKVDFWNKNEGRWREFFFFIFFSKRKTTARLLNRSWSFDLWSLERPQLSSTSHHRDGEGLKTRKHIIIIIMTIARPHSTKLPELVKKFIQQMTEVAMMMMKWFMLR